MSTVYLRIGADKAGTVSITSLAAKNQAVFDKFGIYSHPRNCVHFLELIRTDADADDVPPLKDQNEARRCQAEQFNKKLELGEYAGKDILLVTETLWGRFSKSELGSVRNSVLNYLNAIKDKFPDHKVKVVLQVRRVDLYIESLLKQDIKAGRPVTIESLKSRITPERAFSLFKMIEEAFGRESLIIRPFERSQLYNGCVVEDMLHNMGLGKHVREFEITLGNEGLHCDLMETLIKMNRVHGKVVSNKKLLEISHHIEKKLGYEDVKNILNSAVRKDLIEQFSGFYEYLAKLYGDGDSFFKDPLPDDSHLSYSLDPEREALIKELVLYQSDSLAGLTEKG